MSIERNRAPSHVSEVPGCIGGLFVDLVRMTWPVVLVGGLTFCAAHNVAQESDSNNKVTPTYGEGKLIATPVPISPTVVELVQSQPLQNHCHRGKELRGKTVKVIDEKDRVIIGLVNGADNYFSVRDDEGENKFTTVFCDEIKGDIVPLD